MPALLYCTCGAARASGLRAAVRLYQCQWYPADKWRTGSDERPRWCGRQQLAAVTLQLEEGTVDLRPGKPRECTFELWNKPLHFTLRSFVTRISSSPSVKFRWNHGPRLALDFMIQSSCRTCRSRARGAWDPRARGSAACCRSRVHVQPRHSTATCAVLIARGPRAVTHPSDVDYVHPGTSLRPR